MGLFDGLPNPVAPALAFQQGLEHGRQQREEREVRGALADYVVNPDDPNAFRTLAQYRPEIAMQVRESQQKRQQAAQVADLQQRAAAGDRAAMAQLAGIDLDAYDKLADNHRQDLHTRVEAIGNAALDVANRPPAERPAAWDAYIDQLAPQYPELAQLKGHYSEEALHSAIASAGQMKEFLASQRPDYQAIPEGGTLVNTRDPNAVQAYMGSMAPRAAPTSKEQYDALKPGEAYIAPDGSHRVKGGAGASRVGATFLDGL